MNTHERSRHRRHKQVGEVVGCEPPENSITKPLFKLSSYADLPPNYEHMLGLEQRNGEWHPEWFSWSNLKRVGATERVPMPELITIINCVKGDAIELKNMLKSPESNSCLSSLVNG